MGSDGHLEIKTPGNGRAGGGTGLIAPGERSHRRRPVRARTLPEQIADQIGAAILAGEYRDGERLTEQELAQAHRVSRGPVREALRLLERRGLAVVQPRRGAYAVALTLDAIADLFNLRASLLGLAARYFALQRPAAGITRAKERLGELEAMIAAADPDPAACSLAASRIGAEIVRHCRNERLAAMLAHLAHETVWAMIWRQHRLDYDTPERRRQGARSWAELIDACVAGDGEGAERRMRTILDDARDHALRIVAQVQGGQVEKFRLIRAGEPTAARRRK